MEWRHTFSPAKKKFKSAPSVGKLMLTLFWFMNGPILEHHQEKGETDNSVRYSAVLEEELKPAIRSRRRGLVSKGFLLLHDNARPHSAAATVTTIHPPYSSHLAAPDYHVFGTLKKALRGRRLHSDDEAKETVHFWLRQQFSFPTGIQKLVERCKIALQRTATA
jgi:histone-lysine N-methyltransferase SETMAR